jgi:hypothetical protein
MTDQKARQTIRDRPIALSELRHGLKGLQPSARMSLDSGSKPYAFLLPALSVMAAQDCRASRLLFLSLSDYKENSNSRSAAVREEAAPLACVHPSN